MPQRPVYIPDDDNLLPMPLPLGDAPIDMGQGTSIQRPVYIPDDDNLLPMSLGDAPDDMGQGTSIQRPVYIPDDDNIMPTQSRQVVDAITKIGDSIRAGMTTSGQAMGASDAITIAKILEDSISNPMLERILPPDLQGLSGSDKHDKLEVVRFIHSQVNQPEQTLPATPERMQYIPTQEAIKDPAWKRALSAAAPFLGIGTSIPFGVFNAVRRGDVNELVDSIAKGEGWSENLPLDEYLGRWGSFIELAMDVILDPLNAVAWVTKLPKVSLKGINALRGLKALGVADDVARMSPMAIREVVRYTKAHATDLAEGAMRGASKKAIAERANAKAVRDIRDLVVQDAKRLINGDDQLGYISRGGIQFGFPVPAFPVGMITKRIKFGASGLPFTGGRAKVPYGIDDLIRTNWTWSARLGGTVIGKRIPQIAVAGLGGRLVGEFAGPIPGWLASAGIGGAWEALRRKGVRTGIGKGAARGTQWMKDLSKHVEAKIPSWALDTRVLGRLKSGDQDVDEMIKSMDGIKFYHDGRWFKVDAKLRKAMDDDLAMIADKFGPFTKDEKVALRKSYWDNMLEQMDSPPVTGEIMRRDYDVAKAAEEQLLGQLDAKRKSLGIAKSSEAVHTALRLQDEATIESITQRLAGKMLDGRIQIGLLKQQEQLQQKMLLQRMADAERGDEYADILKQKDELKSQYNDIHSVVMNLNRKALGLSDEIEEAGRVESAAQDLIPEAPRLAEHISLPPELYKPALNRLDDRIQKMGQDELLQLLTPNELQQLEFKGKTLTPDQMFPLVQSFRRVYLQMAHGEIVSGQPLRTIDNYLPHTLKNPVLQFIRRTQKKLLEGPAINPKSYVNLTRNMPITIAEGNDVVDAMGKGKTVLLKVSSGDEIVIHSLIQLLSHKHIDELVSFAKGNQGMAGLIAGVGTDDEGDITYNPWLGLVGMGLMKARYDPESLIKLAKKGRNFTKQPISDEANRAIKWALGLLEGIDDTRVSYERASEIADSLAAGGMDMIGMHIKYYELAPNLFKQHSQRISDYTNALQGWVDVNADTLRRIEGVEPVTLRTADVGEVPAGTPQLGLEAHETPLIPREPQSVKEKFDRAIADLRRIAQLKPVDLMHDRRLIVTGIPPSLMIDKYKKLFALQPSGRSLAVNQMDSYYSARDFMGGVEVDIRYSINTGHDPSVIINWMRQFADHPPNKEYLESLTVQRYGSYPAEVGESPAAAVAAKADEIQARITRAQAEMAERSQEIEYLTETQMSQMRRVQAGTEIQNNQMEIGRLSDQIDRDAQTLNSIQSGTDIDLAQLDNAYTLAQDSLKSMDNYLNTHAPEVIAHGQARRVIEGTAQGTDRGDMTDFAIEGGTPLDEVIGTPTQIGDPDKLGMTDVTPRTGIKQAVLLSKVISGGETGVDIAGIESAKNVGLGTGGYAATGFITETGKTPSLGSDFGLIDRTETGKFLDYKTRTMRNVDNSDGTIVFLPYRAEAKSKGSIKTIGYAVTGKWVDGRNKDGSIMGAFRKDQTQNKPVLVIQNTFNSRQNIEDVSDRIYNFIVRNGIGILNIAGPRESVAKGIQVEVNEILAKAYDKVKIFQEHQIAGVSILDAPVSTQGTRPIDIGGMEQLPTMTPARTQYVVTGFDPDTGKLIEKKVPTPVRAIAPPVAAAPVLSEAIDQKDKDGQPSWYRRPEILIPAIVAGIVGGVVGYKKIRKYINTSKDATLAATAKIAKDIEDVQLHRIDIDDVQLHRIRGIDNELSAVRDQTDKLDDWMVRAGSSHPEFDEARQRLMRGVDRREALESERLDILGKEMTGAGGLNRERQPLLDELKLLKEELTDITDKANKAYRRGEPLTDHDFPFSRIIDLKFKMSNIEEKLGNIPIVLDPTEAYRRGESFYHGLGAYRDIFTDKELPVWGAIQRLMASALGDVNLYAKMADIKPELAAYTINPSAGPAGGYKSGHLSPIRLLIVPDPDDIKAAHYADAGTGVHGGKRTGSTGSSVAEAIDRRSEGYSESLHNEFVLRVKPGNFRIVYDDWEHWRTGPDAARPATDEEKKYIDALNVVLDQFIIDRMDGKPVPETFKLSLGESSMPSRYGNMFIPVNEIDELVDTIYIDSKNMDQFINDYYNNMPADVRKTVLLDDIIKDLANSGRYVGTEGFIDTYPRPFIEIPADSLSKSKFESFYVPYGDTKMGTQITFNRITDLSSQSPRIDTWYNYPKGPLKEGEVYYIDKLSSISKKGVSKKGVIKIGNKQLIRSQAAHRISNYHDWMKKYLSREESKAITVEQWFASPTGHRVDIRDPVKSLVEQLKTRNVSQETVERPGMLRRMLVHTGMEDETVRKRFRDRSISDEQMRGIGFGTATSVAALNDTIDEKDEDGQSSWYRRPEILIPALIAGIGGAAVGYKRLRKYLDTAKDTTIAATLKMAKGLEMIRIEPEPMKLDTQRRVPVLDVPVLDVPVRRGIAEPDRGVVERLSDTSTPDTSTPDAPTQYARTRPGGSWPIIRLTPDISAQADPIIERLGARKSNVIADINRIEGDIAKNKRSVSDVGDMPDDTGWQVPDPDDFDEDGNLIIPDVDRAEIERLEGIIHVDELELGEKQKELVRINKRLDQIAPGVDTTQKEIPKDPSIDQMIIEHKELSSKVHQYYKENIKLTDEIAGMELHHAYESEGRWHVSTIGDVDEAQEYEDRLNALLSKNSDNVSRLSELEITMKRMSPLINLSEVLDSIARVPEYLSLQNRQRQSLIDEEMSIAAELGRIGEERYKRAVRNEHGIIDEKLYAAEGISQREAELDERLYNIREELYNTPIVLDPAEAWSRGEGFYHGIGAYHHISNYGDLPVVSAIQSLLTSALGDVNIHFNLADVKPQVATYSAPFNAGRANRSEAGHLSPVRFLIVPEAADIKWAYPADVGSNAALNRATGDRRLPEGMAGTTVANAIDSRYTSNISQSLHNEFSIELKPGNFRIVYDDWSKGRIPDITDEEKDIIDALNVVLDQFIIDRMDGKNVPETFVLGVKSQELSLRSLAKEAQFLGLDTPLLHQQASLLSMFAIKHGIDDPNFKIDDMEVLRATYNSQLGYHAEMASRNKHLGDGINFIGYTLDRKKFYVPINPKGPVSDEVRQYYDVPTHMEDNLDFFSTFPSESYYIKRGATGTKGLQRGELAIGSMDDVQNQARSYKTEINNEMTRWIQGIDDTRPDAIPVTASKWLELPKNRKVNIQGSVKSLVEQLKARGVSQKTVNRPGMLRRMLVHAGMDDKDVRAMLKARGFTDKEMQGIGIGSLAAAVAAEGDEDGRFSVKDIAVIAMATVAGRGIPYKLSTSDMKALKGFTSSLVSADINIKRAALNGLSRLAEPGGKLNYDHTDPAGIVEAVAGLRDMLRPAIDIDPIDTDLGRDAVKLLDELAGETTEGRRFIDDIYELHPNLRPDDYESVPIVDISADPIPTTTSEAQRVIQERRPIGTEGINVGTQRVRLSNEYNTNEASRLTFAMDKERAAAAAGKAYQQSYDPAISEYFERHRIPISNGLINGQLGSKKNRDYYIGMNNVSKEFEVGGSLHGEGFLSDDPAYLMTLRGFKHTKAVTSGELLQEASKLWGKGLNEIRGDVLTDQSPEWVRSDLSGLPAASTPYARKLYTLGRGMWPDYAHKRGEEFILKKRELESRIDKSSDVIEKIQVKIDSIASGSDPLPIKSRRIAGLKMSIANINQAVSDTEKMLDPFTPAGWRYLDAMDVLQADGTRVPHLSLYGKDGEPLLFPEKIADALEHAVKKYNDEGQVGALLSLYDKSLTFLKAWTLLPFAAYHARNFADAMWRGWIGGNEDLGNYKDAIAIRWSQNRHNRNGIWSPVTESEATTNLKKLHVGQYDGKQLIDMAERDGVVGNGFVSTELIEESNLTKGPSDQMSLAQAPGYKAAIQHGIPMAVGAGIGYGITEGDAETRLRGAGIGALAGGALSAKWPLKLGGKIASEIEDTVRLSFYIDRIRKGDFPAAAAAATKKIHIDYGDLSPWEQKVAKRVFPFFTFHSRNIPLQLEMKVAQPSRYNIPYTMVDWLNNHSGMSGMFSNNEPPNEEYMARWMSQVHPIRVKVNKDGSANYFLLGHWISDESLTQIFSEEGTTGVASQISDIAKDLLSPILRAPLEWWLNYDFFRKRAIDQAIRQPLPGDAPLSTTSISPGRGPADFLGLPMKRKVMAALDEIRLLSEVNRMNPGHIFGKRPEYRDGRRITKGKAPFLQETSIARNNIPSNIPFSRRYDPDTLTRSLYYIVGRGLYRYDPEEGKRYRLSELKSRGHVPFYIRNIAQVEELSETPAMFRDHFGSRKKVATDYARSHRSRAKYLRGIGDQRGSEAFIESSNEYAAAAAAVSN